MIIEMQSTLVGVYQPRQYIQETVKDSFRPRKLLKSILNILLFTNSRGPMLEKTKMTNTKMLKSKAKKDGNEYVTPEQLGDKIGKDTRSKKEDEAELRETLRK